jgi:hypothetical protein
MPIFYCDSVDVLSCSCCTSGYFYWLVQSHAVGVAVKVNSILWSAAE